MAKKHTNILTKISLKKKTLNFPNNGGSPWLTVTIAKELQASPSTNNY
jgi:hypothetical protein